MSSYNVGEMGFPENTPLGRLDFDRMLREKLARAREKMKQYGLSAIICTTDINVGYCTNVPPIFPGGMAVGGNRYAILPIEGEPVLFEECNTAYVLKHTMSSIRVEYSIPGSGGPHLASGATAAGLAFSNAMAYVESTLKKGLDVDTVASRIAFYTYMHIDLSEEVAKLRAMRRIWARLLRERFGAKDPASMALKVGTAVGGSVYTVEEPLINIVRGTIGALAAVLGGVQSMNIACFDEAYAIPTPQSLKLSVRTQQIIAYESGVADVVDPLGGSYYVEWLTDEIEKKITEVISKIEDAGGAVEAIEKGLYHQIISAEAYDFQKEVENGDIPVVAHNIFKETASDEQEIEYYRFGKEVYDKALERLEKTKLNRDSARVKTTLKALRDAAESGENVMPAIIDAVKAYATVGEM
ncbi:MAG: methylmalonyl-CoA mutase family protein [Candidatus Caldarchaeum sp.]